ncbi:hypothetical protein KSP39_PZI023451 [Platanthera zijinensis]|uniref:Uncharacterized protein n=1 Tax=Platanthera zijinensis TaxID=2320716 RepID=A0AAP0FTW4_9ASPA
MLGPLICYIVTGLIVNPCPTNSNSEITPSEFQRLMIDRFDQMNAQFDDLRAHIDALKDPREHATPRRREDPPTPHDDHFEEEQDALQPQERTIQPRHPSPHDLVHIRFDYERDDRFDDYPEPRRASRVEDDITPLIHIGASIFDGHLDPKSFNDILQNETVLRACAEEPASKASVDAHNVKKTNGH